MGNCVEVSLNKKRDDRWAYRRRWKTGCSNLRLHFLWLSKSMSGGQNDRELAGAQRCSRKRWGLTLYQFSQTSFRHYNRNWDLILINELLDIRNSALCFFFFLILNARVVLGAWSLSSTLILSEWGYWNLATAEKFLIYRPHFPFVNVFFVLLHVWLQNRVDIVRLFSLSDFSLPLRR